MLDEGDDPAVRALCNELGARHFSRKGIERYHQPEGRFETRTKHGNYNAWLDATGCFDRYDVVVNFDPDHMPRREFLERTLGYLDDPRVGYVQAAQAYYNQPASFIARGAAEETYAYYATLDIEARHLPRLAGRLPRLQGLLAFVHGLYYLQGVAAMLSLVILVFMLAAGVAPGFLHWRTLLVLVGWGLALELCNLYRQRFFLDPRRKFKLQWWARVLHFAKWPFILLAVVDAARGKRGPYTITSKARREGRARAMLAPAHLTTAAVVVAAALIGAWRDASHSAGLIAAASVVILSSVIVSATELLEFPDPYDPRLLVAARQRRS